MRSGRAVLYGQIVGSVMNACSANSSSIISAWWPTNGNNVHFIDSRTRMSIGEVQFFCQHTVKVRKLDGKLFSMNHIFPVICWKQKHSNENFFGVSAIVCSIDLFEPFSTCSFMPIQRVSSICAHSCLSIPILNDVRETVFIAVPVPLKLCL